MRQKSLNNIPISEAAVRRCSFQTCWSFRNFAIFTGKTQRLSLFLIKLQPSEKHLCWSLFLIKLQPSGKHLCWSLFLIKLQPSGLRLYWKSDSSADVFLWILLIFKNTFIQNTSRRPAIYIYTKENVNKVDRR